MTVSPRICHYCGTINSAAAQHCSACGRQLDAHPNNVDATLVSVHPPPSAQTAKPKPATPLPASKRRAKSGRKQLAIAGAMLSVVLVICLVGTLLTPILLAGPSGRWDLLPAMLDSLITNGPGYQLNPAPPVRSGVPALEVEPLPGLRLSAPADALDQPRQVRAAPLAEAQFQPLADSLLAQDVYALAGYTIDLGMTPDDRFPGELTITVDLQTLDIPETLWPYVQLYHTDDTNASAGEQPLTVLVSQQHSSELTVLTRHNGIIILAIPSLAAIVKTTLITLGVGVTVLAGYDQYIKNENSLLAHDFDRLENDRFIFIWPKTLTSASITPVDRLHKGILARHFGTSTLAEGAKTLSPAEMKLKLAEYYQDPDWQQIEQMIKDDPLVLLPSKAAHGARAMERAYDYLINYRKFRRPGYKIEVWLLEPWPSSYGPLLGFQSKRPTTNPFMKINLDMVPGVAVTALTPANQKELDDLNVTALHELFHIVQLEYHPNRETLVWFDEATVVLLETEAKSYYLDPSRSWNKTQFELTEREPRWYIYQHPLEPAGLINFSNNQAIHHGYGASFFVQHLQNTYYKRQPEAFLPAVFEDYAHLGAAGSPIRSLFRQTGNSPLLLNADFRLFAAKNANQMVEKSLSESQRSDAEISFDPLRLDQAQPFVAWPVDAGRLSLASEFKRVGLALSENELKEAIVVLRAANLDQLPVYQRWQPVGGAWKTIPANTALSLKATEVRSGLDLQRITAFGEIFAADVPEMLQSTWQNQIPPQDQARGLSAFMMLPPPAPAAQINQQTVQIRWTPGALSRWEAIKGYRVTILTPAGQTLTFDPVEPRLEIPLDKLLAGEANALEEKLRAFWPDASALNALLDTAIDSVELANYLQSIADGGSGGLEMEISLQEIANTPTEILGPASPVTRLAVEELPTDISGTWSGRVMFVDEPLSLEIQQNGQNISGGYHFGDDILGFTGQWQPDEKGWVLTLFSTKGGTIDPVLLETYLRPFPGNRLWLSVPPVILSRDN